MTVPRIGPAPVMISDEVFAPFGAVIRHDGRAGRRPLPLAHDDMLPGTRPLLWVNRLEPVAGDILLSRIERHPLSAQSFMPLASVTLLTAVCPSLPDGKPDLTRLMPVLLPPGVGVIYRRGVWHHGLLSPDRPCDVAVLMARKSDAEDTEFHDLPYPLKLPR